MKKAIGDRLWVMGLVIFLSFLQTGCYAEQPENITAQEKSEESNLYLWDFGRVKQGEVLKHKFLLKNESGNILNIKNVHASCGCTTTKVEKKSLAPGEEAVVEVKFNSKGYTGAVQQFVYVHTDSLDTSTTLSINGEPSRTIDNPILKFIIKAEVLKK